MKTKNRKRFNIEILLKEVPWGKTEFGRVMNNTFQAINQFFNLWARNIWTQIKYTKAFNECFETNYSRKFLFSKED